MPRQQVHVGKAVQIGQNPTSVNVDNYVRRCYTTMGLLGTYNKDPTDDLTTLTGTVARATGDNSNAAATQMMYESFGQHCKITSRKHKSHSIQGSSTAETIASVPCCSRIASSQSTIRSYSLILTTGQCSGHNTSTLMPLESSPLNRFDGQKMTCNH